MKTQAVDMEEERGLWRERHQQLSEIEAKPFNYHATRYAIGNGAYIVRRDHGHQVAG